MCDSRNCNHVPDRSKLPTVLESLPWVSPQPSDLFWDQTQLLVAVPVTNRYGDGWYYEISCVTVHCDEDYFNVDLHGEDWGWSWDDVEWFVRLSPGPSSVDVVDKANGVGI